MSASSFDLTTLRWISLIVAAGLGTAAMLFHRGKTRWARLVWVVVPALWVVAAWSIGTTILVRPVLSAWSGPRLAPIAGWWMGYPLYPGPGDVPVTGWIYPPLGALAYSPALLTRHPSSAIVAGRVLSLLFYYGPVAWLLVAEARRKAITMAWAGVAFGLFASMTQACRPLRYVSTEILADAPALGFMAIVAIASSRITAETWRRPALIAATAAILGVWCKQLEVVLVTIPVATTLLVAGWRPTLRLLPWIAAIGLVISGGFLLAFGPREVFFELIQIPSRHPFRVNSLDGAIRLLQEVRGDIEPVLMPLGLGLIATIGLRLARRRDPRTDRTTRLGLLFLEAALIEWPLAMLGFLKLGGDVNSLAHAIYPAVVAGIVLIVGLAATHRLAGILLVMTALVLAVGTNQRTALTLAPDAPPWNDELGMGWKWRAEFDRIEAVLKAHPGEFYLPGDPLSPLLVEGRLDHFEYGVFDRQLAGMPLSDEEIRKGIPATARYLCYPGGRSYTIPDHFMKRALPEFSRPVRLPELPFCEIYERDIPTDSSQRTVPSPGTTSPITQEGTPASSVR